MSRKARHGVPRVIMHLSARTQPLWLRNAGAYQGHASYMTGHGGPVKLA